MHKKRKVKQRGKSFLSVVGWKMDWRPYERGDERVEKKSKAGRQNGKQQRVGNNGYCQIGIFV